MVSPIQRLLDSVDWKPTGWEGFLEDGEGGKDQLPVATHEGVLRIGDLELKCYQLDNGQRVFDIESIENLFRRAPSED